MTQQRSLTDFFFWLLQKCINSKDLAAGREVHALIKRKGYESNSFLGSHLIRMFALCGSLVEANQVFWKLPRPTVFSWSAIISAHTELGQVEQGIQLYFRMQKSRVLADDHVFVAVLKACGHPVLLAQGKLIYAHIICSGFDSDVRVGSTLINMFTKCASLEDAHRVFDELKERNVVTWNAMLSGYIQHGQCEEALRLFQRMQQEGMEPNAVTWNTLIAGHAQLGHDQDALTLFQQMRQKCIEPNSVTFVVILKACSGLAALDYGKKIHGDIIESGLDSNNFIGSTLIDVYARCGSLEDAHKVFDKLPKRDIVIWNAKIAGYALHRDYKLALQCLEDMQRDGLFPNAGTFVSLLSVCSHMGLVDKGSNHFESMIVQHGITPVLDHYTCMVDLLGRIGCLSEAKCLLQTMPLQPNIVGWRTLLGHCRTYSDVALGRQCFEHVVAMDDRDSAGYVLMSSIYTLADMWEDAHTIWMMKKCADVWNQPGKAFIEVDNKVHAFCVGDESHAKNAHIYGKLQRLVGQNESE